MGLSDDGLMESWVLIAGGFHRNGGMDRLNRALALHLIESGNSVHLVCHSAEAELRERVASYHIVPRPANSFMLGAFLLARLGRQVAQQVTCQTPRTRVVVNGGNCDWPDINWVHCVHHAWERSDESTPAWFKLKNRCSRWQACRQERIALRRASVVIANSERTRRDLINRLSVPADRIHVVYPGTDTDFVRPTAQQRAAARKWLRKSERPLVAFVGALGYDSNKGFDVLVSAWRQLCARPEWDADLIVAGGGRGLNFWQRQIGETGLARRITLLGFTDRIADLLAAADLLVSPVRYEAYGLNVQEAICSGVPAMVTASAGVAERYPADLRNLLIGDPESAGELADMILQWRSTMPYWRERTAPFAHNLRRHTPDTMAEAIVAVAKATRPAGIETLASKSN